LTRSRADYRLEIKQAAARLVRAGQRQADVAASLGVPSQTLSDWVKAEAAGKLSGGATVKSVSPEQMEVNRLKAEQTPRENGARNCKKATAYFAKESSHQLIEVKRKAFIPKSRPKCRGVADSLKEAGERLVTFARFPSGQWKSIRTTNDIYGVS
jgi:transposase